MKQKMNLDVMQSIPNVLINILEKTGSPHTFSNESFQWMSSIEELNNFFDWFCHSITVENFVTDDELRCYNHLMKSGKLLSENQLDLKINSYLSCDSDDLLQETSIDGLKDVIQTKERVLNDLKKLKNLIHKELNIRETEKCNPIVERILQQEINEMNLALQRYKTQFQVLVNKVDTLYENIAALGTVVKDPLYICQQNLKQYTTEYANLGIIIAILKKKIFEDKTSQTMENNLLYLPISDDDVMNYLYNWISAEEFKIGIYKSEIHIANEIIRYLSDCERNIEKSNFLFTWNDNNFDDDDDCPVCDEEELRDACDQYVEDIIRGVQLNICRERLKKRKNKLSILDTFGNIVRTRKLCNECLHFLLMNDWKMIRTSVSLLQDVHNCWEFNIAESKKKMAWMKRRAIRQQIPRTIADVAGTELAITVCNTLTLSPNATILDVDDSCIERLNRGVQHHKESITSDFEHFCRGLRKILSEVKKIDEYLFDGPTRVVNYNKEIIESIREIDRIVKSTSISDLLLEYEEHQKWLERNKSLLHMMWYEWNKNPFDVIQTILKLEEKAKVQKRRKSILIAQQLSSVEFQEYCRF